MVVYVGNAKCDAFCLNKRIELTYGAMSKGVVSSNNCDTISSSIRDLSVANFSIALIEVKRIVAEVVKNGVGQF